MARPRPFAGEPAEGAGPHRSRPERLDAGVETLPGVGRRLGASLRALGIATVRDLLLYRPRRYEPPAPPSPIADLLAGEEAAIEGVVRRVSSRPTRRRRLTIVEAVIEDESGEIPAVWFNQAWVADRLRPGARVRLRGVIERAGGFVVRDYDLDRSGALSRIAPVYPASEALSPRRVRELIARTLPAVADLADPLPAALRAELGLPLGRDAVLTLHRPLTTAEAEVARRRLAYEELLALQVGLLRRRAGVEDAVAPELGRPGSSPPATGACCRSC